MSANANANATATGTGPEPLGEPSRGEPHLLLVAGIGGHSAEEALDSLRHVTGTVSVVYVAAWVGPEAVRADWAGRGLRGEFLAVDGLDEAVEEAVALHERLPLDGVVTYSELLLRPQTEIAHRLGLPGNTPESVVIAQSKAEQRRVFAEAGVPSPRFAVISGTGAGAGELAAAADVTGLPAVFKPSLGAGSSGVQLVNDLEELERVYKQAAAADSPFLQRDEAFLLEERMPVESDGDSDYAAYVSVESLIVEGTAHHLVVTDRLRLRHGYMEEGLVLPSRLDTEAQGGIVDCADRAVRAVGLTSGAVHTEIALTPDGPRAIEVNARAGGPVPSLLETAAGYDYAAQIGRAALGVPPDQEFVMERAAWHRFIPIPQGTWRITAQADKEDVLARFPGLVYLAPRFRPGQEVSRDRTLHLASFMLGAGTLDEARATAQAVERALGVELDPADIHAETT